MVSEKSLDNLKRGNTKNVGKKKGKTWKELIDDIGNEAPAEEYRNLGKTWREVAIRRAYWHIANGNAAILRELMQRSEPQDIGIKINFATLTDEQVRRIADGEDPRTVLASPGAG